MRDIFTIVSVLNLAFIIMHEFDAIRRREWKMFGFLKGFSEKSQYTIFLWVHFPLLLFVFYYFRTVFYGDSCILWLLWNCLMILHFAVHLIALRWKSNVFDYASFIWIGGTALTSLINIILIIKITT